MSERFGARWSSYQAGACSLYVGPERLKRRLELPTSLAEFGDNSALKYFNCTLDFPLFIQKLGLRGTLPLPRVSL